MLRGDEIPLVHPILQVDVVVGAHREIEGEAWHRRIEDVVGERLRVVGRGALEVDVGRLAGGLVGEVETALRFGADCRERSNRRAFRLH